MKHFYYDRSGPFQENSAPIHREQECTDDENGINHILWPVQSLDLSLTEYLQDFGLVCAAGAGESCLTAVEGIFCVLPSYLVFSHKPKVVLHPDYARVSSV